MKKVMTKLLNLPGVIVEDSKETIETLILSVRYAQAVTEQVIHSDVSNVAKNNRLTEEQVWSMVISVAPKVIPINVEYLKILGIDEISLVKGQGKFIVVLVDL